MYSYCIFQSIDSWFPAAEHKLASMRPLSGNPDVLQDQIDELKVILTVDKVNKIRVLLLISFKVTEGHIFQRWVKVIVPV